MAYEVFIGNRQGTEDRLNNVLLLGPFPDSGLPVGGKTLEFTSPLATVTFGGSAGAIRTMADIMSDLAAQVTGLVVSKRRNQNAGPAGYNHASGRLDPQVLLVLSHASGFTIASTGTANADFGLSTDADTARGAPVGTTKIVGFTVEVSGHLATIIDLS